MSEFKQTVEKIKQNAARTYNCIPCPFPRFRKFFPGLMFQQGYKVTANSGVGKSQLARFLFISHPLKWVKEHPEADIRLKIIFFSLEESREMWRINQIIALLSENHGIELDVFTLLGVSQDRSKLTPEVIELIEGYQEYFDQLEKEIEIIDHVRNPYGMWRHVREYARTHGKFFYKGVETNPEAEGPNKGKFDEYKPNDPRELVLVVTDHLSLQTEEAVKGGERMSLAQTMEKWSNYYCIMMRNKLGYSFLNVQQQAADTEKQEYTYTGASVESKLEPSLAGLGDSKKTGRDPEWVLGLFAPDRYEMENHRGYDIKELGDRYRSLKLLKVRYGSPNKRVGLYFRGDINHFEELPEAAMFKLNPDLYTNFK